MIRNLLFCFAAVCSFAANANPYVECLQNQLGSLSYDVGPVDGVIGSKTRISLQQLRSKAQGLDALPKLSNRTASIWCGRIGEKYELKTAWPSSKQPIRLEFGKQLTQTQRRLIETESEEALSFLRSSLKINPPGTIVIAASNDMNELALLTHKELGSKESRRTVRQQLETQCRNRRFTGASYGTVVALCFGKELHKETAWNDEAREMLKRLIVHEMSHEFQKQLIGNYRTAGGTIRDRIRGPKWLFEGTAIVFELVHTYPNVSLAQQISWFEKQQSYSGSGLRKLSRHVTKANRNFSLYAGFAGTLIASKNSLHSIGKFWSATPELGWERAFELAFGETVDGFYKRFGQNN